MLVGMKMLSTKGTGLVNQLGDLLFPPVCLFCQEPVAADEHGCASCLQDIRIWPHSVCLRCGSELPAAMQPGPCGRCLTQAPAQMQTHSLYDYHGPVREALLAWKLQGHDAAVRWLVQAAMPRLRDIIEPDALLLPIPMPLNRMRQHGQHHAANLCRWLSEDIGCTWDWTLLRRIGQQPRQSALTGHARRKNLRKAFALATDYEPRWQDISPKPSTLWLVDDILTTGSTLHFAAKASLRLGIAVNVLSLARTSYRG